MKYEIEYVADGREEVAKTFAEALAKVRDALTRTYAAGWRVENVCGDQSDEAIERDFDESEGGRVWTLYRKIDVANSRREYAYITERGDEA